MLYPPELRARHADSFILRKSGSNAESFSERECERPGRVTWAKAGCHVIWLTSGNGNYGGHRWLESNHHIIMLTY